MTDAGNHCGECRVTFSSKRNFIIHLGRFKKCTDSHKSVAEKEIADLNGKDSSAVEDNHKNVEDNNLLQPTSEPTDEKIDLTEDDDTEEEQVTDASEKDGIVPSTPAPTPDLAGETAETFKVPSVPVLSKKEIRKLQRQGKLPFLPVPCFYCETPSHDRIGLAKHMIGTHWDTIYARQGGGKMDNSANYNKVIISYRFYGILVSLR